MYEATMRCLFLQYYVVVPYQLVMASCHHTILSYHNMVLFCTRLSWDQAIVLSLVPYHVIVLYQLVMDSWHHIILSYHILSLFCTSLLWLLTMIQSFRTILYLYLSDILCYCFVPASHGSAPSYHL